MRRPETTNDLGLGISDESTIPPTELAPMPENLKAELRALRSKVLRQDGVYDEGIVQQMVAVALPLEDDLETIRRIQRNGGYKEQLSATQVSLELKRLKKPDAAIFVQQANMQAGREELLAMFADGKVVDAEAADEKD